MIDPGNGGRHGLMSSRVVMKMGIIQVAKYMARNQKYNTILFVGTRVRERVRKN